MIFVSLRFLNYVDYLSSYFMFLYIPKALVTVLSYVECFVLMLGHLLIEEILNEIVLKAPSLILVLLTAIF